MFGIKAEGVVVIGTALMNVSMMRGGSRQGRGREERCEK